MARRYCETIAPAYAATLVIVQTFWPRRARTRPSVARVRTASLAVMLVFAPVLPTSHASAAPSTRDLQLIDQTPQIRLGTSSFKLVLDIDNPTSADRVYLEVFDHVTTQVQFGDVINGGRLPATIDSKPNTSVKDLTQNRDGSRTLTTPLQRVGERDLVASLDIREPGVYPLRVSLQSDTRLRETDPQLITWLTVYDPNRPPEPVSIARIWRIPRTDFTTPTASRASVQALRRNTEALRQQAGPMTVLAEPSTLMQWRSASASSAQDNAAFNEVLRDLATKSRHVIAAPYSTIDPQQFGDWDLGNLYDQQFTTGTKLLTEDLGLPIDPQTTVVDYANDTTISTLRQRGIRTVIVSEAVLRSIDVTLRYRQFDLGSSQMRGLATASEATQRLFSNEGSATSRAQQFGAWLALTGTTHPGASLILDIPANAMTTDRDLAAVARILNGRNPYAVSVDVAGAFRRTPLGTDGQGQTLVREPTQRTTTRTVVDRERATTLRNRLNGYAQLVGDNDASLTAARLALLDAFSVKNSAVQASYFLDRVQSIIESLNTGVSLTTRTITLTSARSRVPLTFSNATGRSLRVRVQLISRRIKQTDPDQIIDLPATPRNRTERIELEVNGSGEFPVDVVITSADGSLSLGAPTRITMNSTVFGTFGSWLTYGAVGFLIVWWGHHGWRKRRAKRRGRGERGILEPESEPAVERA